MIGLPYVEPHSLRCDETLEIVLVLPLVPPLFVSGRFLG